MIIEELYIKGCYLITPKVFLDERGHFFESFNAAEFELQTGLTPKFVQDNQSKSSKGVLRGLHYQIQEFGQAKLIRVVKGKVLDVCVDLRGNSETFGKHIALILDDKNHKQLFIPRGFAHGFLTLEDDTIFNYKCDNYYNKSSERGIIYNDSQLNINWNIGLDDIILSDRDKQLPTFESLINEY